MHFHLINTVNLAMGFSPFMLHMGRSPCVLPPLPPSMSTSSIPKQCTHTIMSHIHKVANTTAKALITSKLTQADATNQHHAAERPYTIGDHIYLSTIHHQHNFKAAGQTHVAKFMPHFNGPYVITHMILERSVYSLDIPNTYPNACLSFHASLLCPYFPSDPLLFPH